MKFAVLIGKDLSVFPRCSLSDGWVQFVFITWPTAFNLNLK